MVAKWNDNGVVLALKQLRSFRYPIDPRPPFWTGGVFYTQSIPSRGRTLNEPRDASNNRRPPGRRSRPTSWGTFHRHTKTPRRLPAPGVVADCLEST